MKQIIWLGNSHDTVKSYSATVKQEIGYNLDKVQNGIDPYDWKPMTSVRPGVKEIRVHQNNEYRVLYVAKFEEAIYVLHSFVKKSEKTLHKDIQLAKQHYADLVAIRG